MNKPNQQKPNTTIIGAGIVGLMTVRALHQRGYQPTVLDIAIAPSQASWSATGHLMHVPPRRQLAGHMIRYQLDAADGHKFVLGDSGGRYFRNINLCQA